MIHYIMLWCTEWSPEEDSPFAKGLDEHGRLVNDVLIKAIPEARMLRYTVLYYTIIICYTILYHAILYYSDP